MPRLFSKKSHDGTIDVTAKVSTSVTLPPAVYTSAAPDISDYGMEFPPPPPAWGKAIPIIFWLTCIAWVAMLFLTVQASRLADTKLREVKVESTKTSTQLKDLTTRVNELTGQAGDLRVVTQWATLSESVREVLISVMVSANERVQVKNFTLKRMDNAVARYLLSVSCSGSKPSFDAMSEDLRKKLEDAGWEVKEAPQDPNETRMLFEATISKKSTTQEKGRLS